MPDIITGLSELPSVVIAWPAGMGLEREFKLTGQIPDPIPWLGSFCAKSGSEPSSHSLSLHSNRIIRRAVCVVGLPATQ